LPLNIIIIGCGLGGLAAAFALGKAGHRVQIIESAPTIGEVGAGIQVTPNVSRILIRWGLGQHLKDIAVLPEAIALRRCELLLSSCSVQRMIIFYFKLLDSSGELIGWTRWGVTMEEMYGSPYYNIHVSNLLLRKFH